MAKHVVIDFTLPLHHVLASVISNHPVAGAIVSAARSGTIFNMAATARRSPTASRTHMDGELRHRLLVPARPSFVDSSRNEDGGGCRSHRKLGLRNPLPVAALNIQQRKHYSHERYRKVKTGLNTATATRPAEIYGMNI